MKLLAQGLALFICVALFVVALLIIGEPVAALR